MNKATKFTFHLALYIVIVFSIAMSVSYLVEYLQSCGFFGDYPFKHHMEGYGEVTSTGLVDDQMVWGARHYWFFWMCVLLFILSIIRMIIWVVKYWDLDK